MVHDSQSGNGVSVARSREMSLALALLGGLTLLATSVLVLLLGPVLVESFQAAMPHDVDLASRAAAAGIALGGGAVLVAVIVRCVRDMERHTYAPLAALLALFSGSVLWGLNIELRAMRVPFELLATLTVALAVASGAAIARDQPGLRLGGWALSLVAPVTLLCVLWLDAQASPGGRPASDAHRFLAAGLMFATSLLLGVFGEASRGRKGGAQTQPGLQDTHAAVAPAVTAPATPATATGLAPSVPPTPLRPAPVPADDDVEVAARLRRRGGARKVAAGVATAAAAAGLLFAVRAVTEVPELGPETDAPADVGAQEPASAAASPATTAPLSAAPQPPAGAAFRPTVERLDAEASEHEEQAREVSGGRGRDTSRTEHAAREDAPGDWLAGTAQPEQRASSGAEHRRRQAASTRSARARKAKAARRAEAKRRRARALAAKRKGAAKHAARAGGPRGAAGAPPRSAEHQSEASAPSGDSAGATTAATPSGAPAAGAQPAGSAQEAQPSQAAAPADDSIEALMDRAVDPSKNGVSDANDPIFGL